MKMSKRSKSVLSIASIVAMAGGLCVALAGFASAGSGATTPTATAATTVAPACTPGTTVRTNKGEVCGTTSDGVTHYLDIPYAAPPVGNLRWKPPQPARRWKGVLKATEPAVHCFNPGTPTADSSENCLNIEVRIPAGTKAGANLPVMYENHGGGFVIDGRTDNADNLLTQTHTVYVYVNYRLGILGFLAEKSLGAHSGNYGLMDQYAGLRWVKQNIVKFGGNPKNVTIFGESAGGSSECLAMTSPLAKGLFQKAIAVSPFWNYNKTIVWPRADCKSKLFNEKQAQTAGAAFAKKVGCNTRNVAACLRKVPAAKLVAAAGKIGEEGSPTGGGTIAPIVNGTTIPMSPARALATGHVNKATLTFDFAGNEFNGGELTNAGGNRVIVADTPAQYRQLLTLQFGATTARAVERLYSLSNYPAPAPYQAYRTVMNDAFTSCPALTLSKYVSKHVPLYVDVNNNDDYLGLGFPYPIKTEPIGAFHSTTNILAHAAPSTLNPNQLVLQEQILSERGAMAYTGNPNSVGAPFWPQFTPRSQQVMSLRPAANSRVISTNQLASVHNCGFWSHIVPQYVGSHPWYIK